MKNKKKIAGIITILAMLPAMAFAQEPMLQTRIHLSSWVGTVSNIYSNSFTLNAANGGVYTVDASAAKANRRFGAIMQVADIQPGDSVVVKGMADGNKIKAELIRDISLQARNGVFSGKVASINGSSFTLESAVRGSQTANTDSATVFKKNGQPGQLADVTVGSQVRVSGGWDRVDNNITAKFVNVVIHMSRINISGILGSVSGNTFTVDGSNSTGYTVDASQAKVVNKSGGKTTLSDLKAGDTLRIKGKHVVNSTEIMAGMIRDSSQ